MHLAALAGLALISPGALGQELPRLDAPTLALTRGADSTTIRVADAPRLSSAWLLGTDRPADLVAARARLEGRRADLPAPDGLEVEPFSIDTDGTSVLVVSGPIRAWLQAAVLTPDGDFLFTQLVRGDEPQSSFSGSFAQQTGFVVVTEFMKDPQAVSDGSGEWIEVYNAGPHRYDLEGSVLSDDGSNAHLIYAGGAGLVFLPGQRLVLGANGDVTVNGGVTVDYDYSSFSMTNGADEIVLTGRNGMLLDRVVYDDGVLWPDDSGKSISLNAGILDAFLNDDPANWCHSAVPMGAGTDTGTPRQPNEVCP